MYVHVHVRVFSKICKAWWLVWKFYPTNFPIIRWGKLNSQFIVTDFLILHAGRRSLFRFQTSKRVQETLGLNSWSPRPRPSNAMLEGAGPKYHIVAVQENLKIHADGGDKLRIQFAWPNSFSMPSVSIFFRKKGCRHQVYPNHTLTCFCMP